MTNLFLSFKYIPILAISPAEMRATAELPDKDKDLILPLFSLKRWLTANKLENTLKRIRDSIDERPWIADIDIRFLLEDKTFLFTGKHPDTEIFDDLKKLLNPSNGFENWCNFIEFNKNLIPCVRHESLDDLHKQIERLSALKRGIVLRVTAKDMDLEKHKQITKIIGECGARNVLVMYDLETIDKNYEEREKPLIELIECAKNNIPDLVISISSTSFPNGFAKLLKGHNSIYERLFYEKIIKKEIFSPMVYSDRGSARAQKQDGGSGTPPPRIDYPLKKDWEFVRREFDEKVEDSKNKRKEAYIEIANEIIDQPYWLKELRLWGTQQIELTAEGDEYGIYSAQKATAARINIHLFKQLHYNELDGTIDTDEEWTD